MTARKTSIRNLTVLFLWVALVVLFFWDAARQSPQDPEAPITANSETEDLAEPRPPSPAPLRAVVLPPPPPASAPKAPSDSSGVQTLDAAVRDIGEALESTPTAAAPVPPEPHTITALKPTVPDTTRPDIELGVSNTSPEAAESPSREEQKPVEAALRQPQPVREARASEVTPREVKVGRIEAQEGRTLLRLLEHGEGPLIQLAWPDKPDEREALYSRLEACFGMTAAVMDRTGKLYRHQGSVLRAWTPNMDLFSGFLRSPRGPLNGGRARPAPQRQDRAALGQPGAALQPPGRCLVAWRARAAYRPELRPLEAYPRAL